jgi:hypothetical protein
MTPLLFSRVTIQPVRRFLFNAVAGVSALLFIAAVVLWVRSRTNLDGVHYILAGPDPATCRDWTIYSFQGKLNFGRECYGWNHWGYQSGLLAESRTLGAEPYERMIDDHSQIGVMGFYLLRKVSNSFGNQLFMVIVPWWAIAAVTVLMPFFWVLQRRRSMPATLTDRCPTCSYDLRASKDRCPECGTPIPSPCQVPQHEA